mmetsp:Transcript_20701/g.49158  ORF Transcript_20701/g.49158 Transcript_20701/m.49158 type:complete len:135 (+) Transcript_20701:681-1085(+)
MNKIIDANPKSIWSDDVVVLDNRRKVWIVKPPNGANINEYTLRMVCSIRHGICIGPRNPTAKKKSRWSSVTATNVHKIVAESISLAALKAKHKIASPMNTASNAANGCARSTYQATRANNRNTASLIYIMAIEK